jgi:photosystem II stability/assembly factor-like uncharacterized protein
VACPARVCGRTSGRAGWRHDPVRRRRARLGLADRRAVYRTSDGGASWTLLRLPCDHSSIAAGFVDDSNGLLVCGGGAGAGSQAKDFYATADGGQTWQRRACSRGYRPDCNSDLPGIGYVGRLAFGNVRRGLLVTDRGGIWRTLDGGRSWRQTLLTDDEWFVASISWASPRTIFALTMQDDSLIRSDDAGAHWRRVWPAGAGLPPGAFSFSSPSTGIGLGSSRILVPGGLSATADGGVTWRHVADLRDVFEDELVRAGPRIVWTIAYGKPSFTGARSYFFLRSTDGGRQWRRRPTPGGIGPTVTLSFPAPSVGFAAGDSGLFRTDDGGDSWRRVGARRHLSGAVFVTKREGLLVSQTGSLLRSGDGGRSWRAVRVSPGVELSGVFALDQKRWWLEAPGYLLRTADGGRSWTGMRVRGLDTTALDFVTPSIGYARAAAAGGLERTKDGGRTWSFVPSE